MIALVSKAGCPFCSLLKMGLAKRGFVYIEYDASDDSVRQMFYKRSGTSTVPQLYLVNEESPFSLDNPTGERIGGWSEVSSDWSSLGPQ